MLPIGQPRIIAGALIAVLVLAGCAPASTAGAPGDPEAAFDLITRNGRFQHNSRILGHAEETLVALCMTAQGIHYVATGANADDDTGGVEDLPLSRRRQEGYGLYRSYTETAEEQHPEPSYGAGFERAYFGDDEKRRALRLPDGGEISFPGDGCLYESRHRIYGGDILAWARVEYVPETFNNKFSDAVGADPAYRAALRGWSMCMAGKGYRFDRPADAHEHLSARYAAEGPNPELRQQEIVIAVSDGECVEELGIAPLVLAIRKRQFDSLPPAERTAIDEITADWRNAVIEAENILRG